MHQIQLDILKRISLTPRARYIDLKNRDVDSNLFMYHLNQLMSSGYIAKDENKKYYLTTEGKKFVSLLSTDSGEIRKQPEILIMLYARNTNGEILLFKWHREPNTNLVSLPHGKMHFGISPLEMAASELREKCNLEGEFVFIGDLYLKTWSDNKIFNHYLCHLVEVKNFHGELKSNTPNGECFWGNIDNFSEVELWPGTWEILDAINNNQTDPLFMEKEAVL